MNLGDAEFFWGVATSGYQSEGGYNGPGEPKNNWARAEAKRDVVRTGRTSEFWQRYEEDFARCRAMGLNAFRLGIEWSRVQPSQVTRRSEPPPFDDAALEHYASMMLSCRAHGLEPIVTLQHFTHPAWLGPDAWFRGETAALFKRFVRHAALFLNERLVAAGQAPLRWFITINEPNMLVLNTYIGHQFPTKAVPGFGSCVRAYNGLLTAHVRAYNTLHDLYAERGWPAPAVTFNTYCSDVYWSEKFLLDLMTIRERGVAPDHARAYIHEKAADFDRAFRDANLPLRRDLSFHFGSLMKWLAQKYGYRAFDTDGFRPLLAEIYASPRARLLDYIGIDYYDPFTAHAFRLPVFWDHEFKNKSFRTWVLNSITTKWWDWRVLPPGLRFFTSYYAREFDRPILIAENGMALRRRTDNRHVDRRDRIRRSDFLRLHIDEITRLLAEGVPLLGYLHWSLTDNYEWGSFTPRFGLFSIDYAKGAERLAEDHTGDRPSETYAELVREARARTPQKTS